MRVTAATRLRLRKATIPPVNLQEYDFAALQNRLLEQTQMSLQESKRSHRWAWDLQKWQREGYLEEVTDFGKLRDILIEKTGADASKQSTWKDIGYVGTLLSNLTKEEMTQLGLDEDTRDALKDKIKKYVTDGIGNSKQNITRETQVLSEREEAALEKAPTWEEIMNTIRDHYYIEILPLYDMATPEVHRHEMETYMILMLYILEPNIRSAWRLLKQKGDNKDDNIISFGRNGVVQFCMNKTKHDTQLPLPGVLCKETAKMMKKHYDMFLKDNQFSDGYFFHKQDGTWWDKRDSFTRHLDDTLKEIFPQANLGVGILRILEITSNWGETATKEEKRAFAFVTGHAWNSNQTSLYNRQNSSIGQKRKAVELDADTDW